MYVERKMRKRSLEKDFFEFLVTKLGAVSLDEDGDKETRPDFQLPDGTLVEIKLLETPPSEKLNKHLEPLRNTEKFPFFAGTADLKNFKDHPAYEENKRELKNKLTRTIRRAFSKANFQHKNYCTAHNIEPSRITVFLNDDINEYSHSVVMQAIHSEIESSKQTSRTPIKETDAVLFISEAHFVQIAAPPYAAYQVSVIDLLKKKHAVAKTREIAQEWCKLSLGEDLCVYKGRLSGENNFVNVLPQKISESDSWYLEYNRNPYLQSYSRPALAILYTKLLMLQFLGMSPDSPKEISKDLVSESFRILAHYISELNARGIELHKIVPTGNVQRKALRELRLPKRSEAWLKANFVFHVGGEVYTLTSSAS